MSRVDHPRPRPLRVAISSPIQVHAYEVGAETATEIVALHTIQLSNARVGGRTDTHSNTHTHLLRACSQVCWLPQCARVKRVAIN